MRDANPSMAKKIADEIARVSVAFIQQKMDQDAPNIIQKGYSDGEPVSPNIMKIRRSEEYLACFGDCGYCGGLSVQ